MLCNSQTSQERDWVDSQRECFEEEIETPLECAARLGINVINNRKNFQFFLKENGLKSWKFINGQVVKEYV